MNTAKIKKNSSDRRSGFALILALALMSLVFLLVVTLITFVGAELRLTDLRKQKVLANRNAQMGLMVAIGELQKHLGPDTRVTATADLLDERIEGRDETYSHDSPSSSGIDLNEDGDIDPVPFGQRHWTGVWKHRADTKVSPRNYETGNAGHEDTMYDSEFDGHPEAEVAWLVSGNEGHKKRLGLFESETGPLQDYLGIPDGISQTDRSNIGLGYGNAANAWEDYRQVVDDRVEDYDHPLKEIPDPDSDDSTVWLLKHPVLGPDYDPENPDDWKSHLVAEPVKVRKSNLEMQDNAQSTSATGTDSGKPESVGSYAYWVADQGVKTKVNIVNPNKESSDAETMRDNLLVATEPNLDIATGFGITFNNSAGERQNLHGLNDFAELGGLPENIDQRKEDVAKHYHSLTTDSFGVLADVRTGGLKRDLSTAFALDDSEFDAAGYADWLFQERVDYMKNFRPMDPDPNKMVLVTGPNNAPLRWKSGKLVNDIFCYEHKANDWLDQAENAFIHDERVKIVGPKWSVLRDFHNLHKQQSLSGSAPSITSNLWPDCGEFSFVRRKGDNSVIFGDTAPHSPGGFFNKIDTEIIQENFNYFRNGNRPEPKNHSISPVLVEIKYSHEIYIDEDGSLCLAMFPAFALWNPYDTAIELGSDDHYELDIKIEDLRIRGFNTKDWEIYQKWRKHENEREWMARKAKAKQNPSIPSPPRPTPITIAKEPAPRPPAREPVISPGTPFIDLNGNGRRDAGEFMESPHKPKGYGLYPPKGGGGGGGGGGGLYQHQRDPLIWYMWNKDMGQKQNKNTVVEAVNPSTGVFTTFAEFRARIADFPDFPAFYPLNNFDRAHENEKRIPLFRPLAIMPAGERRYLFNSKANGRVLNYRDAPLRLTARGVRLEPGEKAYFVPQTITDAIPSDHYKVVVMAKGTEAAGNHLRYKAPEAYFKVPAGDPVTVRSWAKGIKGYNRGDRDELFIDQTSILGAPNGIILNLVQGGVKYPIKKINKNFGLDLDGNTRSFDKASDLMNFQGRLAASNKFGGAGFRLRWKLPGTSRRMTFHEFNPRALVDGYQDGSGDLWEVEVFKNGQNRQNNNPGNFRSMAGRRISPFRRNWVDKHPYTESGGPFCKLCEDKNKGNGRWGGGSYYTDLDPHREIGRSKDGNSTVSDFKLRTPSRPWSNMPYQRNIPRLMDTEAHFGHFHERKEDNNRFSSPRVTMFEIPKSPMLSLMQFRHANLNSYSHSPAYVIGNSYATPQVGRYKKWGRVRRLLFQPQAQDAIETPWEQYKKFRVEYNWAGADRVYNVYPWDEENWNFELGSIRDTHSEHNHQNITMDLSYYSNEALFDGYFLTGGSKPSGGSAMDGQISPFRNPRLKPYYRNGEWARTQYADKSEIADESDNSIAKDQTIAADLLLEGAFNVNSTSVESWVAHLAALKGQAVKVRDLKDGFQVGALGSEETWSDSGATPFLRMSEPTGEGVPAQEPPNKDNDFWTGFVTLTDDQVRTLATKLVEEVKLRGPFLSLSDFVNRRVARMEFPSGNISLPWRKKEEWPSENRTTAQGLRGPVQAAIAKAELNNGGFSWSPQDTDVPEVPPQRFNQHILHDSSFGLHAVSLQNQHTFDPNTKKNLQDWGSGVRNPGLERSETVSINVGSLTDPVWQQDQVRYRRLYYSQAFSNGEAPENLLAVENLATGANMPGWLTQADALTPLAPVLTARSDTFVIRTYGESPAGGSDGPLKRWCEVTVQRLPDYVNSHVDAPHHRPHEPFADDDFDGIWTDGEEWLDLNLNRETARSGRLELKANGQGTSPDLPGGNNAGTFKVGISKDLKLEPDPDLESGMASTDAEFFSTKGINQRFGRKFRIVKFRWLTANEV